VPVLQVGVDIGHPHPVQEQVALLEQELHRVGRERLELGGQAQSRVGHRLLDARQRLERPAGHLSLTDVERRSLQSDLVALRQRRQDVRADAVEQRDAGREQDLRARVRVAAAGAGGHVDDRGHPARHQRVGADPVEVLVVDDRHVAGP